MNTRYVLLTVLVAATGCRGEPAQGPVAPAPPSQVPIHSISGLTPSEQARFYHLSEGGAYFPVSVLASLEIDRDTPESFLERPERFGFLRDTVSDAVANPYGLPVGMSVETVAGVEMAGLNCAACHVAELHYQGRLVRIDGGPNLSDPFGFLKAVQTSIEETLNDGPRRRRFWRRLFDWHREHHPTGLSRETVSQVFERIRSAVDTVAQSSPAEIADEVTRRASEGLERIEGADEFVRETASRVARVVSLARAAVSGAQMTEQIFASADPPFGYGRADAMGIGRNLLFGSVPGNIRRADAAVSFPHLWGIQHGAWLHWGSNTNAVMERNIGQSLGTGALVHAGDEEIYNTVNIENLHHLEQLAYRTAAPSWPEEVLGPVDPVAAGRGRPIYEAECASCHEDAHQVTETGLRVYQLFSLDEVGTDPNAARNFDAGVRLADGRELPMADAVSELFSRIKEQYYEQNDIDQATRDIWEQRRLRPLPDWAPRMRSTLLEAERHEDSRGGKVYPARPLAGIWATAPYLHNGSVPTLYDLLLPAEQRPARFPVGQREYDPRRLGYQIDLALGPDLGSFEPSVFDVALPGNSNAGHEYGVDLPDATRMDLLEYLKVLGP